VVCRQLRRIIGRRHVARRVSATCRPGPLRQLPSSADGGIARRLSTRGRWRHDAHIVPMKLAAFITTILAMCLQRRHSQGRLHRACLEFSWWGIPQCESQETWRVFWRLSQELVMRKCGSKTPRSTLKHRQVRVVEGRKAESLGAHVLVVRASTRRRVWGF